MYSKDELLKNLGDCINNNDLNKLTSMFENEDAEALVDEIYQYSADFEGSAAGYALYLLDGISPSEGSYTILKLLVEKSHTLESDKALFKDKKENVYFNFFIAMLYISASKFISDLPFIKSIIKKTKNLDRAGYYSHNKDKTMNLMSAISCLSHDLQYIEKQPVDFSSIYKMLAHEAILRNDKTLIEAFYNQERKFYLTDLKSLLDYLKDTYFTADEVELVSDAMHFSRFENNEIQKVLLFVKAESNAVRLKMKEFNDLPYELKLACTKEPKSSLESLFAEFQFLLYPEKSLPIFPKNDNNCKHYLSNLSDDEIAEIGNLQNPLTLRELISRPTALTKLLGLNITDKHHSPAAILLAQLLFFKWDEKIQVTKNNSTVTEPLLSVELKNQCQQILIDFYKLSSDTVLMFSLQGHQKELILDLRYENRCLATKVDELQEENAKMSAKVDEMYEMIKQTQELLKGVLLNAQNVNQPNKTDNTQQSEFGSSITMFGK